MVDKSTKEELSQLVSRWRDEVKRIESSNKTEYDQCFYFFNKGMVEQVKKCINELNSIVTKPTGQ